MNYKQYLSILMMVFLCFTCAVSALADDLGFGKKVLMMMVKGNDHIASDIILTEVESTSIGQPLNTAYLQKDIEAIKNIGYFSDVRVETEPFFDGIRVTFVVTENFIYNGMNIVGLTKVDPKEVTKDFTLKPGTVFNSRTLISDIQAATKRIQTEQGLLLSLKSEAGVDVSETGIVTVKMVELKVGEIKVQGLEKTQDQVVLRELSLKKGDLFDYNVLRRDCMRLSQLQLFDNVIPDIAQSRIEDSLDLTMTITEGLTGSFSAGVSYSEDTGNIGGLLEYSENNLMGLGQKITLNTTFDDDGKEVLFSFSEPWLNKNHTSFGMSMWSSDNEFSSTMTSWGSGFNLDTPYDLDLLRTGVSLSFGHPWRDMTASIKFNFERNEIDDYYAYGDSDEISLWNDADLDLKPTDFWNNSAELQLVKNNINYRSQFYAHDGYQWLINYLFAGGYLGGEFDYQKILFEYKWFYPFTDNLVFGTRVQGAYLDGEHPDYESLYLGGVNRLRGYHDKRFKNDKTKTLIGDAYAMGNAELRYRLPFNQNIELVTFADVGQIDNVYGDTLTQYDYGAGVRVMLPFIGMIRFDYAWNKEGEKRLAFGIAETF